MKKSILNLLISFALSISTQGIANTSQENLEIYFETDEALNKNQKSLWKEYCSDFSKKFIVGEGFIKSGIVMKSRCMPMGTKHKFFDSKSKKNQIEHQR